MPRMEGSSSSGLTNAEQQILGYSVTPGNTEEVSLGLLPAGTYYLYVAGAGVALNPSYTLTINAPATLASDKYDQQPGGNNTITTASKLGTLVGASTFSQLTITPGDIDWYQFSTSGPLTSSNYVGLDFDPSEGLIDAEVLDSSGNVIGRADNASYFSSDVGVEARMSLPAETGTGPYTYDVVVYGLQGATSPGYALHFFLPGTNSTNDTPATATPLGILTGINTFSAPTYPLAILSSTDKNYFQFTLQDTPVTGDYVSIASVNGVGALELQLIDATTNDVVASADTTQGVAQLSLYGNPAEGYAPLAAGKPYYVLVQGYQNGTTPSYTLQINAPGGDRFEPDDSRQAAYNLDDMAVGGMGGGYVHGLESWDDLSIVPDPSSSSASEFNSNAPPTADVDWYSFTLATEGLAGNYARIDYDLSLGDLVLGLYNSSGTLITQASTAQSFEQISLQGLTAGQIYYLEVSGFGGATNPDYTLSLDTPEVLAKDTYEMGAGNNTLAAAALGDANLGTIQGPLTVDDPDHPLSITSGDVDWYEFTTKDTGDAGDYVSISYNQAAGPLVLALTNSSGNPVPGVPADVNSSRATPRLISLNGVPAGNSYGIEVPPCYKGQTNPARCAHDPTLRERRHRIDWVNQM